MCLKSCAYLLFLISAYSVSASGISNIIGCTEAPSKIPDKYDRINIKDLQYNVPKPGEILRMKSVYKGMSPVIGFSYCGSNRNAFAPYGNSFAIYENLKDVDQQKKACVHRGSSHSFNTTKYTPMEVILRKGIYYYCY